METENGGTDLSVSYPSCVRCKDFITSGHAYELGDDRWHTHCFSCYRCEKPLSCDSDFLVLGTGTLICFDCSDSCKNCGTKIDDLAIILSSSNEAYCSECFKCCKCGDTIKDLRYAKTKRGLFCIHCHERLLAKRKQYEDRKRRLKKDLPEVPTVELPMPLVIPEKSSKRPQSPVRGSERSLTPPPLSKSLIKSNSGSVISQYLAEDDDVKVGSGSIPAKKDDEDTPKHSRNVSIDDMLNSTLENDREELKVSQEPKVLLNKTPLRNHRATNSLSKSPLSHRQGMILEPEQSNQEKPLEQEEEQGLALNLPSQFSPINNDEDTLTLGFEDRPPTDYAVTSPPRSPSPSKTNTIVTSPNRQEIVSNANESGKNRKIGRSLSLKSRNLVHNLKSKTTGILDPRSSSPSTSRSKTISSPGRNDLDTHSGWGVPSSEESNTQPTPVTSSRHKMTPRGKSDSTLHADHRNFTNPGRNYSVENVDHRRTHSNASNTSASNVSMFRTPPLDNPSIFGRLSNSGSASHYKTSSWQANNEPVMEDPAESDAQKTVDDDITKAEDENESFLKKELGETELLLRKLKLEVRELESKRLHLTSEVDGLQSTKDVLVHEIERLRAEKGKFSSLESLAPVPQNGDFQKPQDFNVDGIQSSKQAETASVARPGTKPRFWKIFSGARQPPQSQQQQHGQQLSLQNLAAPSGTTANTSISSSSSMYNGNNSTSGKLEISGPVLQNPNEFSDVKLLPINMNSQSELSMQGSPSRVDGNILYGSSLVARCSYEQSTIPLIVKSCKEHIESKEEFLRTEGIYRKSGSQLLIEEIEKAFIACDTEQTTELLSLLDEDVHAVASVLKRYLRKLPNPVITFQVYEPLMNTVRENQMMTNLPFKAGGNHLKNNPQYVTALNTIVKILQNLPQEHRDLLLFLAKHIHTVMSYSEANLMTLHNLSLVFAPGLIRDYTGEKDIADMKERNYIVGFIFGNFEDIFS
ncbi:GTPase-activating protein RGA2 TDEL_0D02480 [Torulaspora delbrueckii]|uniref:Rho-GAP domain-containing protein n=1 Tax=Torulaspora delbrueckii TaxID=4950 RepID=G8ZT88_TORDE|nr:hypothetical protein TDEL_0D02480 [Torulaspora delbrueckii]CCE91832.1 hypothetical protein TDEL_0D02480 [Torulaspora delbrueckii]